ncbi:MAG: DUF4957 domain-containing protein [Rikenellaceae bacterium]|nr:DUF4957 domain-containing protein [Rikenellaceae bacterium]
MKKMTLKKLFGGICCAAMAMFAVSCAQGVDDETWTSGVSGVQLESPAAESIAFSLATDASGNEQVKVQWPVSMGAGGYEVTVINVNDPENPEVVVDHETVDGCSLLFPLAEDTNYEVSVLTLANEKYNNAGATSATTVPYSSMIGGVTIPAGSEIGQFITDYMLEHEAEHQAAIAADANFEWAFDLERGAAYTLDVPAKSGLIPIRLRGTLGNRPVVTVGEKGCLSPAAGLKIKNVNFDCTAMTSLGLILMDDSRTDVPVNSNKVMQCPYPVRIEQCWVKELATAIFNGGYGAWGIEEFRLSDCLVQLNCKNGDQWHTFINAWQDKGISNGASGVCWYGAILNTYVLNSTIWNRYPSASVGNKNYFIRFANQSIDKAVGSYNGVFDIKNSTLVRMMPNKDFGNNIANKTAYVITFENSVFHDCYRLQKVKRGGTLVMSGNTIQGIRNSVDSTDKKEFATESDHGFDESAIDNAILDLTAENGGVNFTPLTGNGDPRWLN